MMKAASLNVVRIAESTWSTLEPQPGVFDFTHVDRALDAMEDAGIHVIVGTPTYAVPTWLVRSHPEVLAETSTGQGRYGARQIMNITNPAYRLHAERVIRRLLEHTAHRPGVIGFQLDNETKYYDVASARRPARVRHSTCASCSATTSARSTARTAWTTGPTGSTRGRTSPTSAAPSTARSPPRSTGSAARSSRSSSAGRPRSCASTPATTSSSPTTSTSTGARAGRTGCSPSSTTSAPHGPWTSPAWTSTTRRSRSSPARRSPSAAT